MRPSFDRGGAEYNAYQFRPPQQSPHDPSRNSGAWDYFQSPGETAATPLRQYGHGIGNFQSDPNFGERSMQPSWHHNGYAPSAQQYTHNLASPNVESQNMAFTAEGAVDPQVYGRFQPRPHPSLLHQQSTGSSFTGSENGSNMYLHPGPGAADQYSNVETSEDQLNLSPLLEPSSYDPDDTGSIDLDCIERLDNGQSYAAPWSSFVLNETPEMSQYNGRHYTEHSGAPDSSASGYGFVSTNSSYVMVPSPATSFPQSGIHSNGMYESIATVHPVHDAPHGGHLYGRTNATPGLSIQPATPPIGSPHPGSYFDRAEIQ
ncbi:hypothetical protein B0T12DRAFT_490056 [Alternaria alternata]|nr:hypothetical protein B0T12DRAFT_490056 [Alternaria alternata]